MDLSKLTPAPWINGLDLPYVENNDPNPALLWHETTCIGSMESAWVTPEGKKSNAEFCALARNAFDVMMRRGWEPIRFYDKSWGVQIGTSQTVPVPATSYPDPFTALVEADQWYKEHVERAAEQGKEKP